MSLQFNETKRHAENCVFVKQVQNVLWEELKDQERLLWDDRQMLSCVCIALQW
jgi:hypothetical protein